GTYLLGGRQRCQPLENVALREIELLPQPSEIEIGTGQRAVKIKRDGTQGSGVAVQSDSRIPRRPNFFFGHVVCRQKMKLCSVLESVVLNLRIEGLQDSLSQLLPELRRDKVR